MDCGVTEPAAIVMLEGAPVVIDRAGRGAWWRDGAWVAFAFASPDHAVDYPCACVGPDHTIFVGGSDVIVELTPPGRAQIDIDSGWSANREAWGAACDFGQRVADRLDCGPPR